MKQRKLENTGAHFIPRKGKNAIELIVALLSAEHGEFLALDLGGTNFRVLWVRVTDNGLQKVEMESQIYAIPEDIMRGSGTQV